MSMQVKSIILYNYAGDKRQLNFKLGGVNIITGRSRTGKSAIIDILDYCMGRSTFKVFEGVNRGTVAWYAVVLQCNDTQILLAKPTPEGMRERQSEVYYEVGDNIEPPALEKLVPNTNDDAVIELLTNQLRFSSNLNVPKEGQTRLPLEATIKHSKFFVFQEQGDVASRKTLFHRQPEDFMPQTIKDTLPYLLGASQENRIQLVHDLREAKRDFVRLSRKLNESELIVSDKVGRAKNLLLEAAQVGLVDGVPEEIDIKEAFAALNRILDWSPEHVASIEDDVLWGMQDEINEYRTELRASADKLSQAKYFLREANGYDGEVKQQLMRLESIGVVDVKEFDTNTCPLCEGNLKNEIPTVDKMGESLRKLSSTLSNVENERPRLNEHIEKLTEELNGIRKKIRNKESEIESFLEEQKSADKLKDINSRIARVVGRVSLYLESVEDTDESSGLKQKYNIAKGKMEDLEKQLESDDIEDNVNSILSLIGTNMTDYAERLNLEFSGNPYRLDLNKLTVIADTVDRPIVMERQGSGENWLGCHLISHLALHKHFSKKNRPVPNFLVLDQPSQVYFPSNIAYKSLEGVKGEMEKVDADIESVQRMFDLLFDVCEELNPNFQIIVMEHANLDNERYQDALVEEPWTGGRALIPAEWLKG